MKRNISLIFSLLFIFSACQKEEVEEYVSGARLNFNNDYKVENVPTIRCSFTDSDYLNKTTEITDSIEVVVMGLSTNTDRTFYCTTAPADSLYSMPVTVAESYIIPKNTYSTFIKFSIKAPGNFGKANKTYIQFDQSKNTGVFEPGDKEAQQCIIDCIYMLLPIEWNTDAWGKFSNGKYKFMIDHFQKLHDDIPPYRQEQEEIYDAYQKYKAAGNPPIMDDSTPAKEIEFINVNE